MTARRPRMAAVGALLATLLMTPAPSAQAQDVVNGLVAAASPQPFSPRDLLFMEVTVEGRQLAETMNVYGSRAGVFVPLGEFSRVLDFAVGVFPGQLKAEGFLGDKARKLELDLAIGQAVADGRIVNLPAGAAVVYDGDIYVRLDIAEQLLPVKLKADVNAQTLAVSPTRPLPFQEKLARQERAANLGARTEGRPPVVQAAPYQLFSPPAFDLNVGDQVARNGADQSRSYDLRIAGDLAYASLQAYVGSDGRGRLSTGRVSLQRKDPEGHALGVLGATRAGVGDVFTPSLALGAGSVTGRGVFYSSAPLEGLSLATPLDLRGELPLGEEVELYVNEVLLGARTMPEQGRYEFRDVPLTFGLNTVRLVFYGPQGQRREQVRRINFGSGQVETGKAIVRLGVVEQGLTVIDLGAAPIDPSAGQMRLAASVDYGLSTSLTVSGGLARYTPQGRAARSLGLVGVRTSLGGLATQIDYGADDQGGSSMALGLAARPLGVSLVARHAEYSGSFVDETRPSGLAVGIDLIRATDLRADSQVRLGTRVSIPVSLDMRRLQRTDGVVQETANLRASAPLDNYYLSTGLAYQAESSLNGRDDSLTGGFDVATLVSQRIQVRGGVGYRLNRKPVLESAYITAAVQVSDKSSLQVGAVHTIGAFSSTTVQASQLYRARYFDAALTGSYETRTGEWRTGIQLGLGFAYDPSVRRYRITRPGAAAGGAVAIQAFVDANGDGIRQPDEAPVSKVVLQTPAGPAATDDQGRAFITGLGDGAQARMQVTLEGIDDPFLTGAYDVIELTPRPGRSALINYALSATSEVQFTVKLHRAGATDRPLAAVDLKLQSLAGGAAIGARSDHAGVVFLEGVQPGRYRVTLDQDQAASLGLTLERGAEIVVNARGGFIRGPDILVGIREKGTVQ